MATKIKDTPILHGKYAKRFEKQAKEAELELAKRLGKKEAENIIKALNETNDFESGRKKPISFGKFIKTL